MLETRQWNIGEIKTRSYPYGRFIHVTNMTCIKLLRPLRKLIGELGWYHDEALVPMMEKRAFFMK